MLCSMPASEMHSSVVNEATAIRSSEVFDSSMVSNAAIYTSQSLQENRKLIIALLEARSYD